MALFAVVTTPVVMPRRSTCRGLHWFSFFFSKNLSCKVLRLVSAQMRTYPQSQRLSHAGPWASTTVRLQVNHFTWAANVTLSRFSRAKFAPQKARSCSERFAFGLGTSNKTPLRGYHITCYVSMRWHPSLKSPSVNRMWPSSKS